MGKILIIKGSNFQADSIDRVTPALLDTPSISLVGGTVTIASPNIVYYTTDGTSPTNASTLYEGSFSIALNTIVKAVAYDANREVYSSVASIVYTSDGESYLFSLTSNGNESVQGLVPTKGTVAGYSSDGAEFENQAIGQGLFYPIHEPIYAVAWTFKATTVTDNGYFFQLYNEQRGYFSCWTNANSAINGTFNIQSSDLTIGSYAQLLNGNSHKLCMCRIGSVIYVFADGVQIGYNTLPTELGYNYSTTVFVIGNNWRGDTTTSSRAIGGHIKDVKVYVNEITIDKAKSLTE